PAHDQVVAIAVRPLVEQVFRWRQWLVGGSPVTLRLELETGYVEWFPARLRHILDNLISNALKYRDPSKTEAWVRLALRESPQGYEFRVSDNGVGMPPGDRDRVLELFYRATPARGGRPGRWPGGRQTARGAERGHADGGLRRGTGKHLCGGPAPLCS